MEDDLNFSKMEDNPIFFKNGRRRHIFKMEDDLNLLGKRRQSNLFGKSTKLQFRALGLCTAQVMGFGQHRCRKFFTFWERREVQFYVVLRPIKRLKLPENTLNMEKC
jgi:hypothetical protein